MWGPSSGFHVTSASSHSSNPWSGCFTERHWVFRRDVCVHPHSRRALATCLTGLDGINVCGPCQIIEAFSGRLLCSRIYIYIYIECLAASMFTRAHAESQLLSVDFPSWRGSERCTRTLPRGGLFEGVSRRLDWLSPMLKSPDTGLSLSLCGSF